MQPPFPSPTATWHNDTYPAIHPTNPALSQQGNTVVITGAGSGIGRATAVAFAQAGARHIVLIGRTQVTLEETLAQIKDISATPTSSIFVASVTDDASIQDIAQKVGPWDVLVLNAAHLSPPASIKDTSFQAFWASHETNVRATFVAAHAFVPTANPRAILLAVNSNGWFLPVSSGVGLTGYMTSKIAQAKLIEYLAHEYPDLFICSLHPGVIDTAMLRASGFDESQLPFDADLHVIQRGLASGLYHDCKDEKTGLMQIVVELPAHFMVWLSGPQEKKFLSGRMVWANWDVEELAAKAEEIIKEDLFTVGLTGWPFA
ncbi:hypothetical protein N0V90_004713 [Kalmusia sp. IMI 367209]|nr:hypothetical protein N0V90_004713 [Kalmusia sp. IMI 367209]